VFLGLTAFSAPAFAGGGAVLPPDPLALAVTAEVTAVYNTGQMTGNPLTPPPPNVPFLILVGNTTVREGTFIYLPVFAADDSGPGPFPGFPANILNQRADQEYLANFIFNNYGVTDFLVQVDGQTTVLDNSYITGVPTPPLLDGTPAGRDYICSAAFLTPLTRGTHTIGIGGVIGGAPVVFVSYTVTVK
jgi:hypothetical protein